MIAHEVRSGTLTAARRRRIVRYAAKMGLTAVEAGELVQECREAALLSDDPQVRRFALRLPPPANFRSMTQKFIIGMILAAIVQVVIWKLW